MWMRMPLAVLVPVRVEVVMPLADVDVNVRPRLEKCHQRVFQSLRISVWMIDVQRFQLVELRN